MPRTRAADAGDLLDRAAHVDVHGGEAEGFDDERGVAHLLRHGAEELDGEPLLGGRGGDHLQGARVALDEGAGVDEVGRGPVHAADFAHHEAEGQVGVARQRREEEIRGKLVRTDAHGQISAISIENGNEARGFTASPPRPRSNFWAALLGTMKTNRPTEFNLCSLQASTLNTSR
jgi:hypothetical protein